jgi:hypothetical protein
MRAANLAGRLLRPWADIQELYLQAYACASHRAEPLSRIAQHWLNDNRPAVAYIFASQAFDTPLPPPGPLSADTALYEVTIPDLLSRSAFYCNRRDRGRQGAKKAAWARPMDGNLRRNYHFYTRPLHELVPLKHAVITDGWPEVPGWVYSTPSVCTTPDGLAAVVRSVNYRIRPDGSYDYDGTIRTRNYLAKADINLTTWSRTEIEDRVQYDRTEFPVHGYEDCRLSFGPAGFWATATVRDTTVEGRCEQAWLKIDVDGTPTFVDMVTFKAEGHQKNWKPVVGTDTPSWIVSSDPLTVLRTSRESAANELVAVSHTGRLLGSSQAVMTPRGWLWVDHEVSYNADGRDRVYVHRFVLADHSLERVVGVSDPFYFRQLGIEFCAGLALLIGGTELALSYSVFDASAELAVVPLSAVLALVEDRKI